MPRSRPKTRPRGPLVPVIVALLCGAVPVHAQRPSFSQDQAESIRCLATLALVAHDQERGAPGWEGFPWLVDRSKRYFEKEAARLGTETGRSREELGAEVRAAIRTLQEEAIASPNPKLLAEGLARQCIVEMDAAMPPPAPPSLVECTAMVSLAHQEVTGREGNSTLSKSLANMTAILDSKAREALRAEGKTNNEADIAIGIEKERLIVLAAENRKKGVSDELDFESCFARAGEGNNKRREGGH